MSPRILNISSRALSFHRRCSASNRTLSSGMAREKWKGYAPVSASSICKGRRSAYGQKGNIEEYRIDDAWRYRTLCSERESPDCNT